MKQPTLKDIFDEYKHQDGEIDFSDNTDVLVEQIISEIKDLLLSKFTKDNYSLDEITKTIEGL